MVSLGLPKGLTLCGAPGYLLFTDKKTGACRKEVGVQHIKDRLRPCSIASLFVVKQACVLGLVGVRDTLPRSQDQDDHQKV